MPNCKRVLGSSLKLFGPRSLRVNNRFLHDLWVPPIVQYAATFISDIELPYRLMGACILGSPKVVFLWQLSLYHTTTNLLVPNK